MSELWEVYQNVNQIHFTKGLLVCSVCKNFLSPPVYLCADNGNICKACKVNTTMDTVRNEPLEAALAKTLFPCKYYAKGCHQLLPGDNVMNHQLFCHFAQIKCPCCKNDAEHSYSDAFEHCQNYTQLEDTQVFKVEEYSSDGGVRNTLGQLVINNQTYFIKIQQEECDYFKIMVANPSNIHNHQEISLKINDSPFEIRVPLKIVESFNLLTSTDAKYVTTVYLTRQQYTANGTKELNLEFVLNNDIKALQLKDLGNFRKDIECPICLNLFTDTVYKCQNAHNVCGMCKPLINTCPICREDIGDTIDEKMENLLTQLILPCINNGHGCLFESNLKNLKDHETKCYHHQYDCNMENCKFESCQEMLIKHYTTEHNLQQNGCVLLMVFDSFSQVNILYMNHIFSLEGSMQDNNYVWKLMLINSTAMPWRFMYDINVLNLKDQVLFTLSNTCGNLLSAEINLFKDTFQLNDFKVKCFIRMPSPVL